MGESDNDSWSVVGDDDSVEDRSPAAGHSQHSDENNAGPDLSPDDQILTAASSGSRGNDSPARSVRLEAVGPSAPRNLVELPPVPLPPYPESSSLRHAALGNEQEQFHSPSQVSLATEATPDSYLLAQSSRTPFDLGLPSDSPFASDDLEGDAMSESSTDTHIIVPHPGSDEEDSAERRWRLAEQRGNDIRRARSVLSPRFQGTTTYLKVIVVGEAGLGKTTFIQNLQAALQPDAPAPSGNPQQGNAAEVLQLFEEKPELFSTEVVIQNGNVQCHYLLQDTPGLNYCQPTTCILDHITAKNAAYLACEQDLQRRVPMSGVEDMRVDACLFFINPNSLKAEELAVMAQLAEVVPIVPMIAKADTFMPSELAAFRQEVQQRLSEEEARLGRPITWNPPVQQDDEEADAPAGPPYAVIASRRTDLSVGRFWPVRDYPWGRCETLSSVNSDISTLKQQLFEEGFADLKHATEERYYRFRGSKLSGDAGQGVGDEEQGEGTGIAGGAHETRDTHPARNGTNRGPGGRSSKLWKVGLLVLTTVTTLTMAFNLGKGVGTRRLQQHLATSREMAEMQEQVVSGLASSLSIINKQHASQLRAAQAQLHAMQSPVKNFKLEDCLLCEQDEAGVAFTQRGEALHVASTALMAMPCSEDWQQEEEQGWSMPDDHSFSDVIYVSDLWINGQKWDPLQGQVKAQRAVHNWPMILSSPITSLSSMQLLNATTPQNTSSGNSPLSSAMTPQTTDKPATFVPSNSTAASTVSKWVAACRHRCCRRGRAPSGLAQSRALVAVGHHAAHSMQKMSQQAGLVLYDGLHQSSAAFMRGLATAKAAWLHARQATAAVVQDLGQDLADAGQVVVHETPLVLKRLQEDAHTAAKSTKAALQHAGWKLQRGVHHSLHQVKSTATSAKKKAKHAMHDMKKLGRFRRPKLGKTAKHWLRVLAQIGVLGAAL